MLLFFLLLFFTFLPSLRKFDEAAEKNTRKELPENHDKDRGARK